jgi:hypothetical protein
MVWACITYVDIINEYKILVVKPNTRDYFGQLGLDWRTMLKWILNK